MYPGGVGGGVSVSSIFAPSPFGPSANTSALRNASPVPQQRGASQQHQQHQQPVAAPYPNFSNSPARAMGPNRSGVVDASGAQQSDQVAHLLGVVEQSQQYGRQIEKSVEELAELLHKKTIECEGLRAIAQQKDNGLRQAVRNEYEARIKSESRQLQETRNLQAKIDTLQVEKVQLQYEIESLRAVVAQLQQIPPPANYQPNDHSLFNRVLRGPNVVDDEASTMSASDQRRLAQQREAAKNEVFATWNLPRANEITAEQRAVIHYVANMNPDEARALQSAGVFDFIRVMCARMSTADEDGTYPDLPTVVGELIRQRKTGGVDLATEAQRPIPTVIKNDRQKVTDLFLANTPNRFNELAKLLEDWRGREGQLYEQLKREYESVDASAVGMSRTKVPLSAAQEAATPVELHARVILMYKKYNPQKLQTGELNELFARYPPEVLLASLVEKYGPEPSAAERRELVKLICDS